MSDLPYHICKKGHIVGYPMLICSSHRRIYDEYNLTKEQIESYFNRYQEGKDNEPIYCEACPEHTITKLYWQPAADEYHNAIPKSLCPKCGMEHHLPDAFGAWIVPQVEPTAVLVAKLRRNREHLTDNKISDLYEKFSALASYIERESGPPDVLR